jgi:hypothetical protein
MISTDVFQGAPAVKAAAPLRNCLLQHRVRGLGNVIFTVFGPGDDMTAGVNHDPRSTPQGPRPLGESTAPGFAISDGEDKAEPAVSNDRGAEQQEMLSADGANRPDTADRGALRSQDCIEAVPVCH